MKRKNSLRDSTIHLSSTIANRFANLLLVRGKKNNAYRLLLDSLILSERLSASSQTRREPAFRGIYNQHQIVQKKIGYLNTISSAIRTHLGEQKSQIPKKSLFRLGVNGSRVNNFSSQQKCLQIIDHVKPNVETRKVRKGGTVYQVPCILSHKRQEGIAIRWLINAALTKSNASKKKNTFSERLGEEFSSTFQKSSQSRQKRDQLHNLAAMNRSNIRYRWW